MKAELHDIPEFEASYPGIGVHLISLYADFKNHWRAIWDSLQISRWIKILCWSANTWQSRVAGLLESLEMVSHTQRETGKKLFHQNKGLPRWCSGKESACQYRGWKRLRFNPWVRKIAWRRKWQPTPVLLPGKSHGQKSLAGYRPWGGKESDIIEWLSMFKHTHTHQNKSDVLGTEVRSVWQLCCEWGRGGGKW